MVDDYRKPKTYSVKISPLQLDYARILGKEDISKGVRIAIEFAIDSMPAECYGRED